MVKSRKFPTKIMDGSAYSNLLKKSLWVFKNHSISLGLAVSRIGRGNKVKSSAADR